METAPPIICPRCQKRFKGKPELFGKRIRCPGCQKPFVVPSPEEKIDESELADILTVEDEDFEMTAKKGAQTGIQPASAAMFPEDEGPEHYDLSEQDLTPRCPNCANPLESEDAIVCLYCGYNTSRRTWGKTEKVVQTTTREQMKWLMPAILCVVLIVFLVIWDLFYCLVIPANLISGSSGSSEASDANKGLSQWIGLTEGWHWLAHESLRMWTVIFSLFIMWGAGLFAYKRLILNPRAPEIELD